MEFLKRSWQQIRAQVQQCSPNLKWLIGLSLITLVALLLLVLQYAGRPEYVSINGFSTEPPAQVEARLRAAGIDARLDGGLVQVPTGQQVAALKALFDADIVAPDTSGAFDQLIGGSSPWESNEQFQKRLLWTKQRLLGQWIGRVAGVRSAQVMIDVPERGRLGSAHRRPSASVNVITERGQSLDRRRVEAIAGLVSGAVAEMTPQDVMVVDALAGRPWPVGNEQDRAASDLAEVLQHQEAEVQAKIEGLLAHIPGVIVAVRVQAESIMSQRVRDSTYAAKQPLDSTVTRSREGSRQDQGAEPGVRPNTGADIGGSGAENTRESEEYDETSYRDLPLVQEKETQMLPQPIRKINVSVNVPRSYFVALARASGPAPGGGGPAGGATPAGDAGADEAPAPLDDALVKAELDRIQGLVQPQVESQSPGQVTVSMYHDGPMRQAAADAVRDAGRLGTLLESGWIRPAGLATLVLAALGLMLGMVRRATREQAMPSAQDLAGVPPPLLSDEDVVGEAEETDLSMAGVEVAEQDLRSRRIAEQISQLVRTKPEEAAHLLNKWLTTED